MHCSSLGEFEQGRPVIEKLKAQYPNNKILLTFFSPSGYETMKDYEFADVVTYLPMDGKKNAKRFFDLVNPSLILFIKYEFWHYYLLEAKTRNCPLLLISGTFRKSQPFFKWYGHFYRQMLSCFTHLFVQTEIDRQLLEKIGIIHNVTIAGDTRFDRVLEIAEKFTHIPVIQKFCGSAEVVVAGSTWIEDDKELDHFANTRKAVKFIIAPHTIGKDRISYCKALYAHSILFSEINGEIPDNINTLIIDNIGMLSTLYNYGTVCYVGGGFGEDGVHNVLEAAVYGKPVVFGPEYEKYIEAIDLIDSGGAFSVDNALELEKKLETLLIKDDKYAQVCNASKNYVQSKKGSSDQIVKFIYVNRLLTN